MDDLEVLRHWDQQEHVIASDPNDDWNWDYELPRRLDWRLQLMACIGEQAIGFIQIINPHLEETKYWGDVSNDKRAIDIWIGEAHYLNKGYGTQMMELAIRICFESKNVQSILVDPLVQNTRVHRFYERLGFEWVEERSFGMDVCHIYELHRIRWENGMAKTFGNK